MRPILAGLLLFALLIDGKQPVALSQTPSPVRHALSAKELPALWADLDNPDTVRADRAIRTLAASPEQVMPMVRRHLQPPVPINVHVIEKCITDLDDPQYGVRQSAMAELEKLGVQAQPALESALSQKLSPEARHRVDALLMRVRGHGWVPGQLLALRVVLLLEAMATAEARQVLKRLSQGTADDARAWSARAGLTRLARSPQPVKPPSSPPERQSPETVVWVDDIAGYLNDPGAPVRKGRLKFLAGPVAWEAGERGRIQASNGLTFNGFAMQYLLRARVDPAQRGRQEFDARDLHDVVIKYTDDLREAEPLTEKDIMGLVQELYEPDNHVKCWAHMVPGGEMLSFSPPMKKLILLGSKARGPLEYCLADPRVQNEAALILGAIGNERTVPLLIDCYPAYDGPRDDPADVVAIWPGRGDVRDAAHDRNRPDNSKDRVVCLTYALTYLTGRPIGRSRWGTDRKPENRRLWQEWWVREARTFRVTKPKPNATWVPMYPHLEPEGAARARGEFITYQPLDRKLR